MDRLASAQFWQIAATGCVVAGFVLGLIYGRSRLTWRLRAQLMDARMKAEWEKARREQLQKQLEELRATVESAPQVVPDESSAVTVLRREVDRLRLELHRTLERLGEAERRNEELRARLAILGARAPRRASSSALGGHALGAVDPGIRQKLPDNVLTLWNASGDEGPGPGGPLPQR